MACGELGCGEDAFPVKSALGTAQHLSMMRGRMKTELPRVFYFSESEEGDVSL